MYRFIFFGSISRTINIQWENRFRISFRSECSHFASSISDEECLKFANKSFGQLGTNRSTHTLPNVRIANRISMERKKSPSCALYRGSHYMEMSVSACVRTNYRMHLLENEICAATRKLKRRKWSSKNYCTLDFHKCRAAHKKGNEMKRNERSKVNICAINGQNMHLKCEVQQK